MVQMSDLNAAYKMKFGFPFIIAVRMHTKKGILFEFKRRLQNDTQTEFANDLQNVYHYQAAAEQAAGRKLREKRFRTKLALDLIRVDTG
jgi:2-oxo-4-hydroxy-4-carboxy--5-ureidoimidazoline (OHCU) decarboxylase